MKANNLDLFSYELNLWSKGVDYIAGVDEVGRGAFAGPMVVAAVILSKEIIKDIKSQLIHLPIYTEIKDSKLLSPKKRCYLSEFITKESLSYSIVEISNTDIDDYGLTYATQKLFYEAIKNLKIAPQHVFTDTFEIYKLDRSSQTNIPKGDNKSVTIAAASIVAKVYRDKLMTSLHNIEKYKIYGFDKHKGYGTKHHREMIEKYGNSDLHRTSFHFK